MFAQHITASISQASLDGCDEIARQLWRAYGAGAVSDSDTDMAAEAIRQRRSAIRSKASGLLPSTTKHAPTRFPLRRVQVSPDRARSRERLRHNSHSDLLPLAVVSRFTLGERAILAIVAGEVREHGACDRSYDEIAARAGACRSLARRAIRLAARFGLLSIELRPRPGRKNLTNVLRITDQSWRGWLMRKIGGTGVYPTVKFSLEGKSERNRRAQWSGSGRREFQSEVAKTTGLTTPERTQSRWWRESS